MRPREELPATPHTPLKWERRISTAEKVRQIVSSAEEGAALAVPAIRTSDAVPPTANPRRPKLTTRILPEQQTWIHAQIERFRDEFPRSPRLTVAELVQIAIEQLRESKNLDYLVTKFRS